MFSATNFSLAIDKKGVASLVFDLPNEKINKLSAPVMTELEQVLNILSNNRAVRVLVISSAKKDIFIAGADINEIKDLRDQKDAMKKVLRGQEIMNKIAALRFPTIAVINGACLGGGLELALACKYRVGIVNPKTQLGLPEVNLGIIPGFGGTQRLPKLLGLPESLKIILSGKAIDTRKALKIGLVDELIREEFLTEKLSQFANEILKDSEKNRYIRKRNEARKKRFISETLLFGKFAIFYFARKNLWTKTKGRYPAPFVALEVIKRTYGCTYGARGFKTELEAFCELCVGDISKNLIEIFFTNEALKKDSGIDSDAKAVEVESVAVLGAGIMGGGIAWLFANNDINVRVKDIAQESIALGYSQIVKIFDQLKKIRKLTQAQIDLRMGNVTTGLDYIGFGRANLVIEAVVENMEIKKGILAELEEKIDKDVIIASNTSSLSISEMANSLENPERFVGMHFFNPVNRMPLVEVIYGEKTSDAAVATIVKLSKKLGKTPIVVKDVAGFLVNRILLPYMNEAAFLLQDGAEIGRIDALIEKFGMPMGPFTLADVVGIDVGVKVAYSLQEAYGSRMCVSEILGEIYKNHKDLLGKKSGKGFYNYAADTHVNAEICTILSDVRKKNKIHPIFIRDEDITDRCILMMVNEAAKCLEEDVVKNAAYLDMAMIMGCGFPAFRGGVLKYADSYGIEKLVSKLQDLKKKHGKRFEVSKLLIDMAKKKQNFYP